MKKKVATLLIAAAATLNINTALAQNAAQNGAPDSAAAGISLTPCAPHHTLMRVDQSRRYVLLPVEDRAAESHVRVVKNGNLMTTFNIRLAQNKIDYYVPFDLTPYADGHLVLDIRSDAGRDGLRPVTEALWSSSLQMSDTFDRTNREEKWRPAYHHTPDYAWMNDPNGMFYKDGVWHLCFQYGPYGTQWNNMTWGHSTSKDLMHWQQQESVIYPDALGTIFSGSSVVDHQNTAGFGKDAIIAMYTQADRSQFQSMAVSTDGGMTFSPYKENPVLAQDYEFRDPHMFFHQPTGRWISIMASALNHEMDIYSSADLKTWTKESSFGKGYGCQDGVWECPDLFELPIRGTKKADGKPQTKWVLICNINPGGIYGGSATQYFVGDFDGHTFRCDDGPEVTKWMDWGKDHYAAVSWDNAPAGRRTMIAWMSNWQYANDVPTMQYRSANTLPRDVELFRSDDKQLYLASKPSPEVDAARGKAVNMGAMKAGEKKEIPTQCVGAFELEMTIDASKPTNVVLSNTNGEKVVIAFDAQKREMTMDRSQSGVTDFSKEFATQTKAPLPKGSKQKVRIFVDRSSVEVFEAEGRYTMTNIVFPNAPYSAIGIEGGKAQAVKVYAIK